MNYRAIKAAQEAFAEVYNDPATMSACINAAVGAAEPHIRTDECARIRTAMRRYGPVGDRNFEAGWKAALLRLDQVLREGERPLLADADQSEADHYRSSAEDEQVVS